LIDDPYLLIDDLIATPGEQSQVIDHLLDYTRQPSSLEPKVCLQAATLLCHYTARNADTLESPYRALELARTCATLLSRALEEGPLEADGLCAGAALVLGSPLLEPGLAREQWGRVADLLLTGFEEQTCRVANDLLPQLIEVHVGVVRLGKRTADALVRLYLQHPEYDAAIVKVLQTLAGRDAGKAQEARAVLTDCLETHQKVQRDQQALAQKRQLALAGFEYDWRDMSGGSATGPNFGVFLRSGPLSYEDHRQYLEEIVKVTPHPEECWRLLTVLASHDSSIGRFCMSAGGLSFRVTYGSQLVIRSDADPLIGEMALRHLAEHLTDHFHLDAPLAIRLNGDVLEVDAMRANAYEVGQCINLLRGVLEILHEMGGKPELLLQYAGSLSHRVLYSFADATACLNPQGVVRLLLDMEDKSRAQSSTLDAFFLKNFRWLPCDRADRVLKLVTDVKTVMSVPERLLWGERIIAALLAVGLTQRAQDAAESLLTVHTESASTAPSQQSTAALPRWQLRARSLLLRVAWDLVRGTDEHVDVVERFENSFRAMALYASTDEAVHDYLDWAQSIAVAKPAEAFRLQKNLPAPRTWHEVLRRREMHWRGFDEPSWRSVTWSPPHSDRHDDQKSLSLNGKPVLFRMPFHSALVAKIGSDINEAEVINLCIVNSRHLEPAEVPRVGRAVRILFEKLLSMRRSEPELAKTSDLLSEDILRGLLNGPSIPADAREKLEQMLAELQKLTGSPHEDLLRGLPHLIPPFFQANAREALEWTLAMAQLLADRYPDVATKLLNQVPFDAREVEPEWESLAKRVQGLAPEAPAATGLPVPLVKDILAATDSFQIPRVSVGLAIDSPGVVTLSDAGSSSCVEYETLLWAYVEQIQIMVPTGGKPATLEKCLRNLETAVGLLQQVQCRDPLPLIRGIVQSKRADILQLIGSGRIGCRVNPRDAPDFCGVRARWQLPLDLDLHEADCLYAFSAGLVRSFEPAGMSLLQVLVCHESLGTPQRNRIIDGMFKLWDMNNAAPSSTDGAWAGMLLVLEHGGLLTDVGTKDRANGVRMTLLQRWRAGSSDMPALAAMAVIRPHNDTRKPNPETLPSLEALFHRSRGQPDADRIAMWVMRRLHHLDGKEVRAIESRLRSNRALPLFDDTMTIVEEQMRNVGKTSHLIRLWAWCSPDLEDASRALLSADSFEAPGTVASHVKLAAYARLGLALPGENPDARRLAELWQSRSTNIHIAQAFLVKFAQERLPLSLPDEWPIALALAETAARKGSSSWQPSPQMAEYLATALDQFPLEMKATAVQRCITGAVDLCRLWKTEYPACYKILLRATRSAAERVSSAWDYRDLVDELERKH
jgi:hypothetical protein